MCRVNKPTESIPSWQSCSPVTLLSFLRLTGVPCFHLWIRGEAKPYNALPAFNRGPSDEGRE